MIGAFNQRVSLESCSRSNDGGGGASESWASFATVWAAIEPEGGTDAPGPDRNESRTRYRVSLRRRGDVAAGNRVVTAGRILLVHNILDGGAGAQSMTLLCEATP